MKIGIVGLGVVGSALKYGFEKLGHEIVPYDIRLPDTSLSNLKYTDIVYICVPTPQSPEDGSCDTSIVEDIVSRMHSNAEFHYYTPICIKSTVEPGTTARLRGEYNTLSLFFVPEFLRERHAVADFTENHDILIIGNPNPEARHKGHIQTIIDSHGKYPNNVSVMHSTEAELSKYFSNVFNALRITFANDFRQVCEAFGADYTTIKNAVCNRSTLMDCYLDSNENFQGFSGKCLPKDLAAFIKVCDDFLYGDAIDNMKLFKAIQKDNKLYTPMTPEGMRE